MKPIHVNIITPQGRYKELDTEMLVIDTADGQRGLNHGHVPLLTVLKIGRMHTYEDGERHDYAVAGGVCSFRNNTAEILSEAVEASGDIDVARAEKARERAEKRIKEGSPDLDLKRAEIALMKAINRIEIKNMP